MFRTIRKLRCRIRRQHEVICSINLNVRDSIREHTHYCVKCDTVTLAQVAKMVPTPPIAVMGMSIEDQSEYLQ